MLTPFTTPKSGTRTVLPRSPGRRIEIFWAVVGQADEVGDEVGMTVGKRSFVDSLFDGYAMEDADACRCLQPS